MHIFFIVKNVKNFYALFVVTKIFFMSIIMLKELFQILGVNVLYIVVYIKYIAKLVILLYVKIVKEISIIITLW
jgi:hypothetical protein